MPAAGLAPAIAEAGDWLALQAAHAFAPERVAPLLRAGARPGELLRSLASAPLFDALLDPRPRTAAGQACRVERLAAIGVRLVPLPDPAYPEVLRALDDAPLVLSVRGQPEVLATPAIAIVGARAATHAARGIARRLAHDLADAGFTIVSGLARGIDAEAHRGALEAGGRTIGVLACGIERIYPPEHRRLAEEIGARGAVVSELPLGTPPRPAHFPLRNRIISGLSRAVIVVEARRRSGSLITVRHALGQGREVFVVPGAVDGPFAEGTNQLLREGARAIRSAGDVLEDLGLAPRAGRGGDRNGEPVGGGVPEPGAARLAALLAAGPCPHDELLRRSGFTPGRLATALLELELAGRITLERDGRIRLVPPHADGSAQGVG